MHDRDVDQEDRAPVEVLEQEARGHRAEHTREPRGAGPEPDRLAPLGPGEHVRDDRQRGRHDERAADAHERARCDQLLGGVRERRRDRPDAEDHQPELERTASPEPVAEAPAREEQPGEHERVAVDDPLQLAAVGVEVLRDRGDRDVEHCVVEHDHEQAEAQDDEDPPPPRVRMLLDSVGECAHGGLRCSAPGAAYPDF